MNFAGANLSLVCRADFARLTVNFGKIVI